MTLDRLIEAARFANRFAPAKQRSFIELFLSKPSFESFKKIPVVTKHDLFGEKLNTELLLKYGKENFSKFILSAGSSGSSISFRIDELEKDQDLVPKLAAEFKVNPADVLILNTYPIGSGLPHGVSSIEIGSRIDLLPHVIEKFQANFKKFIFVGFPSTAAWVLSQNILPSNTGFLLGGERVPSYFVKMIAARLGISEEQASCNLISLYGLAEVGLGLGLNSHNVRLSGGNKSNSYFVSGNKYHCEISNGELVISNCSSGGFSFLRYGTADKASNLVNLPSGDYLWFFEGRKNANSETEKKKTDIEIKISQNFDKLSKAFIGLKVSGNDIQALYRNEAPKDFLSEMVDEQVGVLDIESYRKDYGKIHTS